MRSVGSHSTSGIEKEGKKEGMGSDESFRQTKLKVYWLTIWPVVTYGSRNVRF
jgi:hypothetical protein